MLTAFVKVKKECFSLDPKMVKTARELLILKHTVLRTNNGDKFTLYVDTYRNFNGLLKKLVGLKINNLIVWRLRGNALQICVMDYLDDGNIYEVLHYPTDEELKGDDKQLLLGTSLEITTFDEFAEEVTDKELQDMLGQLWFNVNEKVDDDDLEVID